MNDEGNEVVCVCVCVFVTRREGEERKREKTRKEDFGGVCTVRESAANESLVVVSSSSSFERTHVNEGKQTRNGVCCVCFFSSIFVSGSLETALENT